jgi:hypothetical protein
METSQMSYNWWMDEENTTHTHTHTHTNTHTHYGVLFSHKEDWNFVVHRWIDGTGEHHVK